MYGDTSIMRRHAGQLVEQAAVVTTTADHLVAQSESIAWTGRAADALRARVRERAAQLREAAALHETAADSLNRHIAEVDRARSAAATGEGVDVEGGDPARPPGAGEES